jgi:outer membrane lipoprotein SlyB
MKTEGDQSMRAQWCLSLVVVGLLSACATPSRGTVYSRHDIQRPWTVQDGVVVQVVEATIEGRETPIGTLGGGFIGHAMGHGVGHGAGSSIGGAVGAVAGAVIGRKAEKVATQQKAWEILVDLDQGKQTLAIVQPADQEFANGEKVRVYTRSDGSARVAKL